MEISRRLGLALVLACLCLPNVIGSGNLANGLYPQSKPTPEIATDSHRLDGFYFGVSKNQLGKRGWLLSLDSEARRGQLYMPPGNLELTGLEVNNAGQVSFHSTRDVGDLIYRFEGQVGSSGVLGQFIITRAYQTPASETSHVPVTLRRMDLPKVARSPVDLSGVYSSVKYNLDSGDVTGDELVLFGQGQEFTGIFTAFEGDMLPYVLVDFARSGNRIRFRIITQFGEENYAGSVVRRGLRLRRLNANDDHNAPVLFKRKDVTNIFPPVRKSRRLS